MTSEILLRPKKLESLRHAKDTDVCHHSLTWTHLGDSVKFSLNPKHYLVLPAKKSPMVVKPKRLGRDLANCRRISGGEVGDPLTAVGPGSMATVVSTTQSAQVNLDSPPILGRKEVWNRQFEMDWNMKSIKIPEEGSWNIKWSFCRCCWYTKYILISMVCICSKAPKNNIAKAPILSQPAPFLARAPPRSLPLQKTIRRLPFYALSKGWWAKPYDSMTPRNVWC